VQDQAFGNRLISAAPAPIVLYCIQSSTGGIYALDNLIGPHDGRGTYADGPLKTDEATASIRISFSV